LSCSVIW